MYDPSVGRWLEEDPEGFSAGDVNLARYVKNDPTNFTDPTGLRMMEAAEEEAAGEKSLGEQDTDAFKQAAKKNGVPDAYIDLILQTAQNTPAGKVPLVVVGSHQICFNWVMDYAQNLIDALNAKFGNPAIPGVKSMNRAIFAVPFGAEGNEPNDIPFDRKLAPYIIDFLMSGGPSRNGSTNGMPLPPSCKPNASKHWYLDQDHTTYKMILNDGSVWYIDIGTIQRIRAASAGINDVSAGNWRVTPADHIPTGWRQVR